ncbi:hypothetical protein BJ165DRAFT_1464503 [Panaeolus papilionaceus]|nr:hypothetical protein BJ165DRAFT_1464503 [Panaeolus papilionaceus]
MSKEYSGFTTLPTDVHLAIVAVLPWRDIVLRIRKISKLFYDISRQKSLWTSLIMSYQHSSNLSCSIERPLHMYTSAELEAIFLRWKRASFVWTRPTHSPDDMHTRVVHSSASFGCNQLIIIPGGRWLLLSTIHGSVSYVDLASTHLRPEILIPPRLEAKHRTSFQGANTSVTLDQPPVALEDPMSFTLAHAVFFKDSDSLTKRNLSISIWQVKACTTNGPGGTLVATRLFSTVPQISPSPSYVQWMIASPTRILYSLENTTSELGKETYSAHMLEMDAPTEEIPGILLTALPFDGYRARNKPLFSFLGQEHAIVLNSANATNALTVASLDSLGISPDRSIIHQLDPSINLPVLYKISHPLRIHDTTRWVGVSPVCTILGFIVPDSILDPSCTDPSRLPTCLTLWTSHEPRTSGVMISIGYNHVSFSSLNRVDIVTFSWPDDEEQVTSTVKTFTFSTVAVDVVIDELSGTLVRSDGHEVYVSQAR